MKKAITLILIALSFGASAEEMQNEGSWYYKKDVNKMTDATDVVAITSTKDIYSKKGIERRTSLVMRCKENTTDAYLSLNDYIGNDDPGITLRFDDGKPEKRTWSGGEGGDSAFAPNAVSFIKELTKHKKLIAGFEPYGSTMQIVEFDLTGVDKIAQEISKACNWKL